MKLETIGVVGAGVMGIGVAQCLAQAGFQVILIDTAHEILERARTQIRHGLRLQALLDHAVQSPDAVLKRITLVPDVTPLERADYVVENVTEKWEIKREIYSLLEKICAKECIFAANTSAIPIARIASATKRQSQVIGVHFMNPVPMKKTVEVIRGAKTSEETLQTTGELLSSMGKDWVLVNDAPGFVSNRVLMLALNEAISLVQDGVAAPADVDRVFRDCLGHKMGPLETADLIGLDTVLLSSEVLFEHLGDCKYQASQLLRDMVDRGLLGRKNGKGFYTYNSGATSASETRTDVAWITNR